MKLTHEDVLQILKLVEESHFNELHLEMNDIKINVRKGSGDTSFLQANATGSSEPVPANPPLAQAKVEAVQKVEVENPEAADGDYEQIKAPLLGIFYRRPELGAPPYVEEQTYVDENTTVGLIEVMKLFNPVLAGVRGYIHKICVGDGELVEHGQTLFLVKREGS